MPRLCAVEPAPEQGGRMLRGRRACSCARHVHHCGETNVPQRRRTTSLGRKASVGFRADIGKSGLSFGVRQLAHWSDFGEG